MPKFGTLPKELESWQQDEKARTDWDARAEELERDYPGRFVALVEDEVFAADTAPELLSLVHESHPDAQPAIRYIPERGSQSREKKNPARRDDVYL
jgi:hypothetical protein